MVGKRNNMSDSPGQTFLQAGAVVNQYKIIRHLGSGGMGDVYMAYDTVLSRNVALKFMPVALQQESDLRDHFIGEAKTAAQLTHPNIVSIYEVSEFQNRPFFSMEYVEGCLLMDFIANNKPAPEKILNLAIQICEGLQAAHDKRILHCDIKSSNIIVDTRETIRILDFGLASIRGLDAFVGSEWMAGTIAYLSPERVRGESAGVQSDIWSLGVVLYEMLTGQLPFSGDYEQAVRYSILNDEPLSIADSSLDIPEALEKIVFRAISKDREKRYKSAAELKSDLVSFLRKEPAQVDHELPPTTKLLPSIAVLPFVNLCNDKEQDYFCDGMAEEITGALSRLEGLRVVARTSAYSFKDSQEDIRHIGRKLNVKTLLEGTVRKAGNRLRISAKLINVEDGFHIWSEKFDREIEDVFAIQDEISLSIVEKLRIELLSKDKEKLLRRFTDNLEAYSLYLKGRYFWNRRYEGGLQKGLECFRSAIEKEPRFAPAYAGAADSYNLLGLFGFTPPGEAYRHAKKAAAKALEIDETLAEAHASMGWIKMFSDWDWTASEEEFRKAIELNPNYATAHEWHALLLVVLGRFDEAIAEVLRAQELDPLSSIKNAMVGFCFGFGGMFDQAVDQLRKTLEMDPEFPLTYFFLGAAYKEKAMWKEAVETYEKLVSISGRSPYAIGFLGSVYGMSGQKDKALQAYDQLNKISTQRYVSPFYRAMILMGLGDKDRAFEYLDQAYNERESLMAFVKSWPFFDSLRSDPRFLTLVDKMNYPG
jgi:serine/threonine protein kinase